MLYVWLPVVPYLALAAAGVTLFTRKRDITKALVAIGFAAVAVSHIMTAFVSYSLSNIYNNQGDVAAATGQFHGWIWQVMYWANILGIWVAAASLLWDTLVERKRIKLVCPEADARN